MSNAYYISLSGMLAASYGLQNTANNVANLQSSGFKRNDVLYSSLGNFSENKDLSGVCIGGSSINFSAGHYLETTNPTDLAIIGEGFFVVRLKNGELVYTRCGEFTMNHDGLLIDKHSSGLVQGYNQQGNLVPIQQSGPKTNPGKATHFIDINGEFILIEKKKDDSPAPPTPGPTQSKYENIHFSLSSIFDDIGKEHTIYLEFEASSPITNQDFLDGLEWNLIKVTVDTEDLDFDPQTLVFQGQSDGSTEEPNNSLHFLMPKQQSINLKFGTYMSDKNKSLRLNKQDSTNNTTTVNIYQKDGYGEGKQLDFSFDDNGVISYNYDNGQSIQGLALVLAKFSDEAQSLTSASGNLFRAKNLNNTGRTFGVANRHGFGSIKPQQLESSNVDSTTEFANIVVLQRMFQACSQIMEIDKQFLEELYKK